MANNNYCILQQIAVFRTNHKQVTSSNNIQVKSSSESMDNSLAYPVSHTPETFVERRNKCEAFEVGKA